MELSKVTKTAGTWDRKWPVYFSAVGHAWFAVAAKWINHVLIPVNQMDSEKLFSDVKEAIDRGVHVMLDSGIFSLTQAYAAKHGVSMDVALKVPPDKIDGFDDLMAIYMRVARELGPTSWGYVELDQGGRENKIKMRASLEEQGLRPIPVYHPLNDGWDYFDYLAERYDRICFGNVVEANKFTRHRLLTTAFERAARYPHLWVHTLGVTPNEWVTAVQLHSSDSSSWEGLYRWGTGSIRCAGEVFGEWPPQFVPKHSTGDRQPIGSADSVYTKATSLAAVEAELMSRNINRLRDDYRENGLEEVRPGVLADMRRSQVA